MKKTLLTLSILALSWTAQAQNIGVEDALAIPESLTEILGSIEIGDRTLLTDSNSMSLYTFDDDSEGLTTCFDSCLSVWPALIVEDASLVSEPFGVIERPDDGSLQVTANGLPLYYFFQDQAPGDLNGEYPTWRPVPVQ